VFNWGDSTPNGVLSQSFATTAGVTYRLSFDAGAMGATQAQRLQVDVQGNASLLSQLVTVSGPGLGQQRWVPQSFTFVADRATATLTFRDVSLVTKNLDMMLDNVRVIESAPLVSATLASPGIGTSTVDKGFPHLYAIEFTEQGARLLIEFTTAGSFVVERSEDLRYWTPVRTMQVAQPGSIVVEDDVDGSDAAYYRVVPELRNALE
jgi:hypothetical protein